MRTQRGKGLRYKAVGGLLTGLSCKVEFGRSVNGKAPFISSDWLQGLCRGKSQSLEIKKGNILSTDLSTARGNAHSGSFHSKSEGGEM